MFTPFAPLGDSDHMTIGHTSTYPHLDDVMDPPFIDSVEKFRSVTGGECGANDVVENCLRVRYCTSTVACPLRVKACLGNAAVSGKLQLT